MDTPEQQPDLITQIGAGVARHVLTSVAGALVTEGVINSRETTVVIGAGMAILGVAWSWWQKVGQAKALEFVTAEFSKLGGLVRAGHAEQAKVLADKQIQEKTASIAR